MTNLRDFHPLRVVDFLPVMDRQTDSALVGRIVQIAFSFVFVAVGLYALRGMMFGSSFLAKLVVCGLVGGAIVFALDKRYWLLPVFLFGFQNTLPALKFTGLELGSILLFSTYFVRRALHKDSIVIGAQGLSLAAIPFLAWMCLVWYLNPVGMFIFGSSSVGGRFYLKVVLAFLSLICFSSIRFSDWESKAVLWVYLVGLVIRIIGGLFLGEVESAFTRGTTHYQFSDCGYLAAFFLCRFSAAELLCRFWPFFGFLLSFILTMYSGNRHMFAVPPFVGLTIPLLLRRDRVRTYLLVGLAAVGLAVVVAGHGTVWRLPYSVQRSLSFLPGRWDYRLQAYGLNDNFRATLRMYAREHIAESPWFGDGGFSLDYSEMSWVVASEYNHPGDVYAGHVLARNWHNVWLGMAADFGIPFSVGWAFFTGVLLLVGFRWVRAAPPGTWFQTASSYFYVIILVTWVDFFFNGGHSAKTPERFFIWSGLLHAVANGYLINRQSMEH